MGKARGHTRRRGQVSAKIIMKDIKAMSIEKLFNDQGYVLLRDFFSTRERDTIQAFTQEWICKNIQAASSNVINTKDIDLVDYHNIPSIDHSRVASAKYRYIVPDPDIIKVLEKSDLVDIIKSLSHSTELIRWQDPGYGWLGYRIIRPKCNDGYPPSCKDWGAAKGVYSLWLPITGCTSLSSIRILPGSHRKKYSNYLPDETHFTKGELRLSEEIPQSAYVRHDCSLGDVIVYHPAVIHSEDSIDTENTRVNLEYRYRPQ